MSGLSPDGADCDDRSVAELRAFVTRFDTVTGKNATAAIRKLGPADFRAVVQFVGVLASAMVERLQGTNCDELVDLPADVVRTLQQLVVGLSRRGDTPVRGRAGGPSERAAPGAAGHTAYPAAASREGSGSPARGYTDDSIQEQDLRS